MTPEDSCLLDAFTAMASPFSLSLPSFQPTFSPSQTVFKPLSVLNTAQRTRIPYELKQGQRRLFQQLPSGLSMEVLEQKSGCDGEKRGGSQNPALVFVHGSYHAAWCWAEHWLPFFSGYGFDCYALSLLGQGESDTQSGAIAGTLQTHASDVADFIRKNFHGKPPVLIGHSFGGLIIQYYIANISKNLSSGSENGYPDLAGAILVCSVPPSGNSGLVLRYIFSKPIAAFKVTLSLAAKAFQTNLALCKETFFSSHMDDQLVQRYQELMKESSRMPLFDLRKLNASLPVPKPLNSDTRVLVLGAEDDFIVDDEGLQETGRFYDVEPECVEGVAHDMMLDSAWRKGAEVILLWLNGLDKQVV